MNENNDELWSTIIPTNITQSKRILGFRMRNIIEGIIAAIIAGFLINFCNFVPRVQAIVTVGVSGSFFVLNLLGIKGMSYTESLINLFVSRGIKKEYHLRSIKYVKKQTEFSAFNGQTKALNESLAEKGFRKAKEFIKEKTQKA